MKLDALSIAALAVAGLAVATMFRRPQAGDAASAVFGMSASHRQQSGAAQTQNTDYLRYWSTPMAGTIYSNGSLGD